MGRDRRGKSASSEESDEAFHTTVPKFNSGVEYQLPSALTTTLRPNPHLSRGGGWLDDTALTLKASLTVFESTSSQALLC